MEAVSSKVVTVLNKQSEIEMILREVKESKKKDAKDTLYEIAIRYDFDNSFVDEVTCKLNDKGVKYDKVKELLVPYLEAHLYGL